MSTSSAAVGAGPQGPAGADGADGQDAPLGGQWGMPAVYVATGGMPTIALVFGQFQRVDASALGTDESVTWVLPFVDASSVGRRVGLSEVTGYELDGLVNGRLFVTTTSGQAIDTGIVLPLELLGERPRYVFAACEFEEGVYGWTVESGP